MQEFMEKAKMEKIPREEYEEWIRKSMPADLYETVTARYGEFPGKPSALRMASLHSVCSGSATSC